MTLAPDDLYLDILARRFFSPIHTCHETEGSRSANEEQNTDRSAARVPTAKRIGAGREWLGGDRRKAL